MAKRFKLRIYRVIASSFQSCRSKDPSTLPTDPVPSFFRLSPVNQNLITIDFQTITTTTPQPTPPSSKHHQHHRSSSSIKRHVSSAFISVGCGFGSKSDASGDDRTKSQDFQWKKEEEEWQIVAKVYDEVKSPRQKIYNSSVSGDSDVDALAPPPPPMAEKKKKRRTKKKKTTGKHRVSTSSADSASFCSEEREKEETEILVSSSRSFSTDSNSTEFNPHLETIREKPITTRRHKKKKRGKKRCVSKEICRVSVSAPECETPARLSVFKRLIPCAVEGKVKESFAVVKKSEDPYEDFKRSMVDMIWEKQMFEERELEQLLQCFLSLNSRHHHGVIVDVFTEIWNAMFCTTSTSSNSKALSITTDHNN